MFVMCRFDHNTVQFFCVKKWIELSFSVLFYFSYFFSLVSLTSLQSMEKIKRIVYSEPVTRQCDFNCFFHHIQIRFRWNRTHWREQTIFLEKKSKEKKTDRRIKRNRRWSVHTLAIVFICICICGEWQRPKWFVQVWYVWWGCCVEILWIHIRE